MGILTMAHTVAVMQPYFMPYLGYFRLLRDTDLFVIYDCVQFPRRGYVHRNQVPDSSGNPVWLTLPLAKCDQKTAIADLQWRTQDLPAFSRQLTSLSRCWDIRASPDREEEWQAVLTDFSGGVVDYLERTLRWVCSCLDIPFRVIRSSSLDIDTGLKGQARILEICRRLNASRYLNAPGGRALYQDQDFALAGVELTFLPEFSGSKWSMAYRLLAEDKSTLLDAMAAA